MTKSRHNRKWTGSEKEALMEEIPLSGPSPKEDDGVVEVFAKHMGRTRQAVISQWYVLSAAAATESAGLADPGGAEITRLTAEVARLRGKLAQYEVLVEMLQETKEGTG